MIAGLAYCASSREKAKIAKHVPVCQPPIAAFSKIDCKPSVQITQSSVMESVSERESLAEQHIACGYIHANQKANSFELRPVGAGRRRFTLIQPSEFRPPRASVVLPRPFAEYNHSAK